MKKNLQEIVGVPEHILESGEKLYNIILEKLKRDSTISYNSNDNIEYVLNNLDLKINELTIKKINLLVELEFENTDGEIMVGGAGFAPRMTHEAKEKFVSMSLEDPSNAYLSMLIYLPEGETVAIGDVYHFLKQNSYELIPTLSHELKHAYDSFKKTTQPLSNTPEYQAKVNFSGFGIRPLKMFFHNLYLSTLVETLVKPTEVAARMRLENVKQTKFLEFLLNDKTFKEFMEMKNYTFEQLYSELESKVDIIIRRFKQSNIPVPNSNPEIIKRALELAYINFTQLQLDELRKILLRTDFEVYELIIGFDPESVRGKYFEKKFKEYTKYKDNPMGFYTHEIQQLNEVGQRMIKKIGKLYAIAQDDNDNDSGIIRKIYRKTNS